MTARKRGCCLMTRIMALSLLLLLVTIACQATRDREDLSGLTADDVFARLEEALTREGAVFHATMKVAVADGEAQSFGTNEAWLDMERGVGRGEWPKDPSWSADVTERVTIIIREDVLYLSDGYEAWSSKAEQCPGVKSAVLANLVFYCEEIPQASPPQVDAEAEYEGTAAVALVYQESANGSGQEGGNETITSFYIDRETFLPLAWITEFGAPGSDRGGKIITRYDYEFVPVDSLPPDFFDPSSIGYVKEDPEAPLDDPNLGVTVYWLGREFSPGGGLPPLALSRTLGVRPPGGGPGDRAMLEYQPTAGGPTVILQLWRLEDWEQFLETSLGQLWWDSPCVQGKELQLDAGRAVIFMGYEPEHELPLAEPVPIEPGEEPSPTPTRRPSPTPAVIECPVAQDFDRFLAHVYLGDTVVAVNAPLCLSCVGRTIGSDQPDPYDSLEGMDAIAKGLIPRAAR